MGEAALEAMKSAGLSAEDIDYLVPHQANIRILKATARRVKLPPEKLVAKIHKLGNISAASIPIALHEILEEGKLCKGKKVVFVAFGAGFTWGAIAYRW
jgi:3-oxoacyl-[acyl-carrier-protein] synthase-3